MHQIVDAPMPRHAEEIVEVGQIILQENITKSRQIVFVFDPQKLNWSTLGVLVDERREDIFQFFRTLLQNTALSAMMDKSWIVPFFTFTTH